MADLLSMAEDGDIAAIGRYPHSAAFEPSAADGVSHGVVAWKSETITLFFKLHACRAIC